MRLSEKPKLNNVLNVQVSDTTGDDNSTKAGYIISIKNAGVSANIKPLITIKKRQF